MAKIRHVAIFANEPPKLADFYKTTFGMNEVARGQESEGAEAIYLSDGYINLAILPTRGRRSEGIEHFGFEVEDIMETGRVAKEAGAAQGIAPRPRDGRYAEFRLHDPVGTPVDLSEKGWRV
jgi:catechol 2,3-dioxygenase-like lactoylglutathione lyase family enzyme